MHSLFLITQNIIFNLAVFNFNFSVTKPITDNFKLFLVVFQEY